ncbi:MAG: hypothetical protein IJX93_04360, partial [Clostridia bacterium]|nr:hypothetical protein [Clostridia bacterium]
MKQISLQEARDLYLTHPARLISQEQSRIYYENFSGDVDVIPYLVCGCLAVKSGNSWHIHALSENAELLSAIESVKKARGSADESLMVLTWGNIPAGLQDKPGSYKFSRSCMPYSDDAIRTLTAADRDAVLLCCAPDPDDNNIGQGIAEDFRSGYDDYLHDPNETLLGIFIDGVLAGFVQSSREK